MDLCEAFVDLEKAYKKCFVQGLKIYGVGRKLLEAEKFS